MYRFIFQRGKRNFRKMLLFLGFSARGAGVAAAGHIPGRPVVAKPNLPPRAALSHTQPRLHRLASSFTQVPVFDAIFMLYRTSVPFLSELLYQGHDQESSSAQSSPRPLCKGQDQESSYAQKSHVRLEVPLPEALATQNSYSCKVLI